MRAFIAAVHLCAAAYIGALMYRPAPVVAAPVKVPSWIKTDKLPGKVVNPPWPEKIVQTESYPHVAAIHTTPERVSLPWSCDTIRQAVAGMTDEQIERIARIYRLTKQQRVEARKCLTKGERS